MEVALVDPSATGYATFQSHNHKVVWTRSGVFLAYLRTCNEAYTAQQWRLVRTRDGGRSFETVWEGVHATNPPVLEADAAGNVYLVRVDFAEGSAYLYRFLASRGYRDPEITRIPQGAAGKYCLCLDERRRRLYYFAHNGTFHVLALDGRLLRTTTLLRDGPHGALQYPLLALGPQGALYAAWTTVQHGAYLYRSIQLMKSRDGGETWETMAGKRILLPAVADETGPTDPVTGPEELGVHTWLASMIATRDHLHLHYLRQSDPPRHCVVRWNVTTGHRDPPGVCDLSGETLSPLSLDGFFCAPAGSSRSLAVLASRYGRLVCLRSDDAGATWRDHAVSAAAYGVYALGGCRRATPDGWIIGAFTDTRGVATGDAARVYFVRVRWDAPRRRGQPAAPGGLVSSSRAVCTTASVTDAPPSIRASSPTRSSGARAAMRTTVRSP